MKKLPSQAKAAADDAVRDFNEHGELIIEEPCNCGSQIRHNNGGNYHEIIYLSRDEGQTFVKYDSTCELSEPAEWELTADAISIIRAHADWL